MSGRSSHQTTHRVAALFAAGAVGMLAMISTISTTTSAAAPPLSDRMVSALAVTGQSEVRNSDGSVTDSWIVDGVPVSVTGPAMMVVTADLVTVKGGRSLEVTASPPEWNKSSIQPLTSIYDSWCVTLTPSGGYGQACDLQSLIQQNGADWYLSDETTYSAHYGNGLFSPSLEFMYDYIAWQSGNSIVKWTPVSAGIPVNQCEQTTVSISFIVGLSQTFTVCPQKWGMYTKSTTQFGVYWSGQSQSWEGIDDIDVVHSPPSANANSTLHVYMFWA